jgi:hypothetical protein
MAVISLSSPLPFLPRHPMNLPSLPSEVLTLTASYPSWQPFITPPWSSKPHHPTMTTLPPITSLQRQYHYRDTACSSSYFSLLPLITQIIPTVPPLATIHPPQQPPQVTPPTLVPPPLDASRASLPYSASSGWGQKPPTPPPDNVPSEEHVASWFSDSRSRSSQYTAENTCEMICYLWFSQSSNLSPVNTSPSQPFIPFNPKTAKLQFSVSSVFVHFMQKLLQTTQLSQSVIVLSLHYVFRLKERNSGTIAHPGSEFRVAVAALMMANKFVDE